MHIIHLDKPHLQKIAQILTLDVVFNAIAVAVIVALIFVVSFRLM